MANIPKQIRASIIDGRAATPYFKRRQIFNLHQALIEAENKIVSALQEDGCTSTTAQIAFSVALKAIAEVYNELDPSKALEKEQQLAKSVDNLERRLPFGCLFLVPAQGVAMFYSIVVPLAAAIGAGNCAVVRLPQTTSSTLAVVRATLLPALDCDTFAIVSEDLSGTDGNIMKLDCQGATLTTIRSSWSSAEALSITVIDASANIHEAAKAIAQAVTVSKSGYAPNLVLVNEFQLPVFSKAIANHLSMNKAAAPVGDRLREQLRQKADIVYSGSHVVAVVHDEQNALLRQRFSEGITLLHPVSSSDRAIDVVNSFDANIAALYVFGAPAMASYISQFIAADLTYMNGIPIDLLVTPISPLSGLQPFSKTNTFSYAAPQVVTMRTKDTVVQRLPTLEERHGGSINFFEQGILTGLSIALQTINTSAVAVGFLAWKHAYPAMTAYLAR